MDVLALCLLLVLPTFAVSTLHVTGWRDAPTIRRIANHVPKIVLMLLTLDELQTPAGVVNAQRPEWLRRISKASGLLGAAVLAVVWVWSLLALVESVRGR